MAQMVTHQRKAYGPLGRGPLERYVASFWTHRWRDPRWRDTDDDSIAREAKAAAKQKGNILPAKKLDEDTCDKKNRIAFAMKKKEERATNKEATLAAKEARQANNMLAEVCKQMKERHEQKQRR